MSWDMSEDNRVLRERIAALEAENAALRSREAELLAANVALKARADNAIDENAALREDKARLVEALGSIRNWRPPDGTLLEVKDLQWFKDIAAARKEAAMTLAEINESIAHAEDLKDRVRKCADEEEVQEYRQDMYSRIDRINNRLAELYQERQRLEDAARKGGT